jgi:hypothetical protein
MLMFEADFGIEEFLEVCVEGSGLRDLRGKGYNK